MLDTASFFSFTRFSRVDYSAGATYSYQQVDARTAWVGTPDYYLPLSNAAAGYCGLENKARYHVLLISLRSVELAATVGTSSFCAWRAEWAASSSSLLSRSL